MAKEIPRINLSILDSAATALGEGIGTDVEYTAHLDGAQTAEMIQAVNRTIS